MTRENADALFEALEKQCGIPRVNGKLVLVCAPQEVSLAERFYGESRHIVASPILDDDKVVHDPSAAFLHVRNKRTKRGK